MILLEIDKLPVCTIFHALVGTSKSWDQKLCNFTSSERKMTSYCTEEILFGNIFCPCMDLEHFHFK